MTLHYAGYEKRPGGTWQMVCLFRTRQLCLLELVRRPAVAGVEWCVVLWGESPGVAR